MLRHASIGAITGSSRTGDDYLAEIASLSGKARENKTLEWVQERWLPPSMLAFSSWPKITIVGNDANGVSHKLVMQVSPDFLKLGEDEESAALAGTWPTTAQKIADELGVRTIGKKLAREIYKQAAVKGPLPNPGEPYYDLVKHIPRNIEDSRAWAAADKKRRAFLDQQIPLGKRASTLVAGHAKDVVQQASALAGGGKHVGGSQLAIYGASGGTNDGWAIQPFPGPHNWDYGPDYSHAIRFARNRVALDGKADKLDRIVADPVLASIVTEAGPFNNRMSFPPTGLSLEGDAEDVDYMPTGRASDMGDDAVTGVDDASPPPKGDFVSNLIWPWGPIGGLAIGLVWATRHVR